MLQNVGDVASQPVFGISVCRWKRSRFPGSQKSTSLARQDTEIRFRRKTAFGNSLVSFCFRVAMPAPQSMWVMSSQYLCVRFQDHLRSFHSFMPMCRATCSSLHHVSCTYPACPSGSNMSRQDVHSDALCSFVEFLALTPKAHETSPAAQVSDENSRWLSPRCFCA